MSAYVFVFLDKSVRKFLRKGLVIETWKETGSKIKPPLLVLFLQDGWKTEQKDQACVNKEGEELKLCIESNTLSHDEIFLNNNVKYQRKITFSPQVPTKSC